MAQNIVLLSQTQMTSLTNSLSGDVSLNNTGTFFDGPSVAQGTSGVWFVVGTITLQLANSSNAECTLWDGTTVIASGLVASNTPATQSVSLSGVITPPAGNIRISVKDTGGTTGKIAFNASTLSKDSTITVIRIG